MKQIFLIVFTFAFIGAAIVTLGGGIILGKVHEVAATSRVVAPSVTPVVIGKSASIESVGQATRSTLDKPFGYKFKPVTKFGYTGKLSNPDISEMHMMDGN